MHTFSPNQVIPSGQFNENFAGLQSGAEDNAGNSLLQFRGETLPNFVLSGLVWSQASGLNGAMTAGTAYVTDSNAKMQRLALVLISSRAFTASKDTYVDLGSDGVLDYNEVANAAAAPALAANHLRLCKVVTDGTNITSVAQTGFDSLGNLYSNKNPYGTDKFLFPTFQNGWINYDTTWAPAYYFKDKSGRVQCVGLIKSGTTTAGTVLFNLPAGYRPGLQQLFATASNDLFARIEVMVNGDVTCGAGTSATWLSLTNMTFMAAG